MKLVGSFAALIAAAFLGQANAQSFTPSSAYLRAALLPDGRPAPSPWSGTLSYGLASDYADSRQPRAYNHVLVGNMGYKTAEHWSWDLGINLSADAIDGQIPKSEEQSYSEAVRPGTSLELSYDNVLFTNHGYALGLHGEPLWDEDSRQEGYLALLGADASARFNFFSKQFSMTHVVDVTSMVNTYKYGSNLKANPDYFVIYHWKNAVRFARTWKASFAFGAKVTRYLDGFTGYSYNNAFALSKTWEQLTGSLSYENGGFTDDGYLRLWYLDEYRRVFRLMVSYAF